MNTIRNRIYVYIPLILVALFHNVMHESFHFLFASLFGEKVLEFCILTNGWGSSQVIFATPIESRIGLYWLVIAWAPAMLTTLAGYLVYWKRDLLITAKPLVNLFTWYFGALFMTIDPLYIGVFSWFIPGTDVEVAALLSLPAWPFRMAALVVFIFNLTLVYRWRSEARANLDLYRSYR